MFDESRRRARHGSASPFERSIGFSRAVRVGSRISVSGTAPIGPDGRTVPGDAADQARRCLGVIREAIEALGGRLEDVVRTRVFLTHRDDWPAVGAVHGEVFGHVRPAATMVVVAGLLDPAWRVEIEAEAEVAIPADAFE